MRTMIFSCLVVIFASDPFAESLKPPLADTRLSVSTLILKTEIGSIRGWHAIYTSGRFCTKTGSDPLSIGAHCRRPTIQGV